MTKSFDEIKDHAIEQSDRPASITRKEAEKVVRGIMRKHLGEPIEKDCFNNSVNSLMEEINGVEVIQ